MDNLRIFLLAAHIGAGTLAVAAGLYALLAAKGGRHHRGAGRWFARCMAVVIGAAAVLTAIRFNAYFLGLTASALVAVFSGTRVLRRKRPDLDPRQRARPVDWAVAIAVALVAIALFALAATGRITANLPVVYSLAGGCFAYAAWDLWRFACPLVFPFHPRLWLYEHLVKMIGGYFGAVAAFSGSVLVFLDPPWRQLWAVSLGQALAIAGVVYYRRRALRSEHAAA